MELHTPPIGGHLGLLKTYHMVKNIFFYEGVKIDVQKFVEKCLFSQQNKGEEIKKTCPL